MGLQRIHRFLLGSVLPTVKVGYALAHCFHQKKAGQKCPSLPRKTPTRFLKTSLPGLTI
jgi:hypothetical protein